LIHLNICKVWHLGLPQNLLPHTDFQRQVFRIHALYSGVPECSLSPVTGYPDWDLLWFSWVVLDKCPDSILLCHHHFLWNAFQFIWHYCHVLENL
jgi:hypothetical protein